MITIHCSLFRCLITLNKNGVFKARKKLSHLPPSFSLLNGYPTQGDYEDCDSKYIYKNYFYDTKIGALLTVLFVVVASVAEY